MQAKPLLMIDVDGVISLFGPSLDTLDTSVLTAGSRTRPAGRFALIDGIAHFLSATAGEHLLALSERFDPVWCSGWEEKANEYLPHLLGLPGPWPHLSFQRSPGRARAHWKLAAIEAHADARPLAWIDDAFNDECWTWATERSAAGGPTLLVGTDPRVGLEERHMKELVAWAEAIAAMQ